MIGNNYYSKWGLKSGGEDITNDILDIVSNANSFIVIGGYNFSFRKTGIAFFYEIRNKANKGVPVLFLIPPYLAGKYNPQPHLINFCITNNIGVILNRHNHSKWLMTENDLYYGSSNFTPVSWRDRVEVVTIHRHNHIMKHWMRPTILDFTNFIQREIWTISDPARKMQNYPGLIPFTTNTWNSIIPLVLRLNPSIEKVKETLDNFEKVELALQYVIEQWFLHVDIGGLEKIYEMNSVILESFIELCEYAYSEIYNETTVETNVENKIVIDNYNNLHSNFMKILETQIEEINNIKLEIHETSELFKMNLNLITKISPKLKTNIE